MLFTKAKVDMDKLGKRVDTFVFEIEQKGARWIEVKNGSQPSA
jgi:hypothetical protein